MFTRAHEHTLFPFNGIEVGDVLLTHLSPHKMAAVSQKTFSNVFSRMKILIPYVYLDVYVHPENRKFSLNCIHTNI